MRRDLDGDMRDNVPLALGHAIGLAQHAVELAAKRLVLALQALVNGVAMASQRLSNSRSLSWTLFSSLKLR
jgi:hypothetical protein